MAKMRKRRDLEPESGVANPLRDFLGNLDFFDVVIYLGVFLVTLIVPFLYSRLTTENFLTPKEFVGRIAMGVLMAIFGLKALFNGRLQVGKSRLDLPLTMLFALAVISLLWNYNVPSAVRDLRGTFLILMLYPLINSVVKRRWQFDGILWAMVIAGVATSALGIMEAYNIYLRWDPAFGWFTFARDEIFSGRIDYSAIYIPLFPQLANKEASMMSIVSTFGNRNYLGTFSMFVAFIPLAFCFYYRNIALRVISFGLFGIMAMGLFITRCRAALLGIIGGVVFMVVMMVIIHRRSVFLKRILVFMGIVVLVLAGIMTFSAKTSSFSMFDKLKQIFTLDRKTSNTYERLWVWYGTYQSFAHNPIKWLMGSGFGSFKHFFPLQEPMTFDDENKETFTSVTFRQAHNDWLQLVSELGLVGMAVFLLLLWRFNKLIYDSVRKDLQKEGEQGDFSGDHVLLIGLGAAMFSQLVAAGPDFPFHRIETALYAVVALALVPLFAETHFFGRAMPETTVTGVEVFAPICIAAVVAGLFAVRFESECWKADILVREVEYSISARNQQGIAEGKGKLLEAIQKDYLPGDPYLKMSSILEMEGNGEEAMVWAEKAWKNINFNARSTYHSVIFRLMHVAYHVLGDRLKAYEYAKKGWFMTCGDARSIYYFYLGKIAMDLQDFNASEWAFRHALQYPAFAQQAGANLCVVLATIQRWSEALKLSASISASVGDADPTMLDVLGISASNLGQHATAETALRKAISLKDDQPIYKRDLGMALIRMNRIEEGRKYLDDAYTAPNFPEALKAPLQPLLASISLSQRDFGMALLKEGKTAEGVDQLKKLYAAKVVPEQIRGEVASVLTAIGAFKAEQQGPASATPQGVISPTPGSISTPLPVPVAVPATSPVIPASSAVDTASASVPAATTSSVPNPN